jgi:outer membrane protein OmpA-like peptidoglycan-associated protein
MRQARAGGAAILLGASMLAGCASRDLVVVLPERDGHVGAVMVGPAGPDQVVLDRAYAAAHPGPNGARPFTSNSAKVDREFGPALAALPAPPATFRLYFLNDSTEMTPNARENFEKVFAEIAHRPAPEIVVTGHTDTVGKPEDNDKLSYDRAAAIAELFAARGVPRDSITVAGRGDRELLIPTADQVPEPRNRRVEITVR